MNEVTDSEILKVYFGINVDFKVLEKKVQTAKGQITKSLNADKKEFAIFSKTDGYCGEEFVESEETGTARRKGIAAERDIQDLHEKAIAFRIA